MALKRLQNGIFEVKTKAQAQEALEQMIDLQEAITELKKENSIDEMELDATELKKAATQYLAEKEITELDLSSRGKVAKLVIAVKGMWIGTTSDIPKDAPRTEISTLKSILDSERWRRITRRVPDPLKIQELVASGELDENEISKAYYEKSNAPYLRLYDA